MSSPFPGMDPFLEASGRWRGFHHRLITSISDYLSDLVSPDFYVDIEELVYISDPSDPGRTKIAPDISVARESKEPYMTTAGPGPEITAPTIVDLLLDPEVREAYVEIYDAATRAVVAVIEVLSPTNKIPGAQGRAAFLNKRGEVMRSQTHWIEIDLLRDGERPEDVSGRSDYYALLKRGGARQYEIWYFDLRDELPIIAVPLRPPYSDVPLPLRAVVAQAYERGHYADYIDYSRPLPQPRLSPTDQAWVERQVGAWIAQR